MKIRHWCLVATLLGGLWNASSQDESGSKSKGDLISGFKEYYPIHVKPHISYLSDNNDFEEIVFDAKPTVYYSFYNNMRPVMQGSIHKPSYAVYASFQPHLRMYNGNSLPVKTPSYRILLGMQGLIKTESDDFLAWAFETGHYSNGQSGCAFAEGLTDETSECTQANRMISNRSNLSALLNRSNGNFSTNFTKLTFNYRLNDLNETNRPYRIHSFSAAYELYHKKMFGILDKGGYSDFDIGIYGRHRFELSYEFTHTYAKGFRYALGAKAELIEGAHPFVEPFRGELSFTCYPFNRDVGVYAKYITGHDDYNYRFVDSGNQFNIGITWDWFTPFEIKRAQQIQQEQHN